jgi:hypothetical protein
LARRLVQVGIRTMNPAQKAQAERFGVEVIPMRRFSRDLPLELEAPLYISLDLDVLDPAFAPGVSHHEPGGLSVRDVLDVLAGITVPVVGADIVEYNPVQDHGRRSRRRGSGRSRTGLGDWQPSRHAPRCCRRQWSARSARPGRIRIATLHLNRHAQLWVWGRPPKPHRVLRRRFVYCL